jgi:hypothetical protein
VAREELRAILPPALSARIDWTTLTWQDGEAVGDGEYRHADLVARCRLVGGRDAYIVMLFEHQSRHHPWMPLRFLGYGVRFLERAAVSARRTRRKLPLVIAVLLHAGRHRWRRPRSMDDLYDADDALLAVAGSYAPRVSMLVEDLNDRSEAEIRAMLDSAYARLAVLVMRGARVDRDPVAVLERAADLCREVSAGAGGRDAMHEILGYLAKGAGVDLREARPRLAAIDRGLEEDMRSWIDDVKDGGRAEGRIEVLLELITEKFGAPPPSLVARIRGSNRKALDAIARRILTASTTRDLLGNDGRSRSARRTGREPGRTKHAG